MKTFPVQLNLEGRTCLVIGGGSVALRKIRSLLECGAAVQVISPEVVPEIEGLAAEGKVTLIKRCYRESDLRSAFLVVSATDDNAVNHRVAQDCAARNILVNVVDNPQISTFIMPATVRQGDLTITVSTNGTSPLFAAKLCQQFRQQFGPEYAELLELLGNLRQEILSKVSDPKQRRSIFASLVESDLLQLLREGDETRVKERIDECISLL